MLEEQQCIDTLVDKVQELRKQLTAAHAEVQQLRTRVGSCLNNNNRRGDGHSPQCPVQPHHC